MSVLYVDLVGGTDTLPTRNISNATRANPCVITSVGHGFSTGQIIVNITGVVGMSQLNTNVNYNRITVLTADTFELDGIDSTSYSTYSSGGVITFSGKVFSNATQSNPCVITSAAHGYSDDDYIFFNNVGGMTELEGRSVKVANSTTDTFELSGVDSTAFGAWTSGGTTQRAFYIPKNACDFSSGSDEIRIGQTAPPIEITSSNLTWTDNSRTVTTSSSLVGIISINTLIGRPGAAGNGAEETFYHVAGVTSTSITLYSQYHGVTGTDIASVLYHSSIQTAGILNSSAVYISKTCTVNGGWNLETSIQDGETWIKPIGAYTQAGSMGLYAFYPSIVEKLNFFLCYKCFNIGADITISNCTGVSGYLGTLDVNYKNNIVSNTMLNGCLYTNYASLNMTSDSEVNFTDSIAISLYGTRACQVSYRSRLTGGSFYGGAYGCYVYNNAYIEGASFYNHTYGMYWSGPNVFVGNSNFSYCTYGFRAANTTSGFSHVVDGCTISNCNTGISVYYTTGISVQNNIFESNTYDIDIDSYSGSLTSINNTHITPLTYSYRKSIFSGPCYIYECTIDAPSLLKAFSVTSGDSYVLPQYFIQNSFGISGTYWPTCSLIKDSSTFRTSGPSLFFKFNTTSVYNWTDIKMVSCYAKSGQTKKFNIYIKRDAATWTGDIVPHFKLNGINLTTESAITSLTTSWVLYEYTCPGALITSDGELSLDFNVNSNTTGIWIDDFTVVDV